MTLGGLATACGLPAHSPHTAVGDTLTTAQLFIATARQLDAVRPETVHRLATASRRLERHVPASAQDVAHGAGAVTATGADSPGRRCGRVGSVHGAALGRGAALLGRTRVRPSA